MILAIDPRITSFNQFLKGSHHNDTSLIKFLPKDVLQTILDQYVKTNFTIEDMIEFKMNKYCIDTLKRLPISEKDIIEIIFWGCKYGNMEIILWMNKNFQQSIKPSIIHLEFAVKSGNLDLVKFIHHNWTFTDNKNYQNVIYDAAKYGYLEILKWLNVTVHDIFFNSDVMDSAAKYGHFEVVKWLHLNRPEFGPNGVGCTHHAMDYAALSGYLEIVVWLHENRTEGCSNDAMDWAARNGHLDIVKWLHTNRSEGCTQWGMDWAAQNGKLEVVKWLHFNRSEGCTKRAMNLAAVNGHLDVIKWLHENRIEGCTKKAMYNAAGNGHLDVVMWLHENRKEGCTRDALIYAAERGYLEVVKFLYQNYQKDIKSDGICTLPMDLAAGNGHIEVLKFLHTTKKEFYSIKAIQIAEERNNKVISTWLNENRK